MVEDFSFLLLFRFIILPPRHPQYDENFLNRSQMTSRKQLVACPKNYLAANNEAEEDFNKNIFFIFPFIGHFPIFIIYHNPSTIRIFKKFIKLIYPISWINRPFDIGVTCRALIDVIHVVWFIFFAQAIEIHSDKENCLWFET